MTGFNTIQRKVQKLELQFIPQPPLNMAIIMFFGCADDPHSKYGIWKLIMGKGYESITEEEELKIMREKWENNDFTRYGIEHSPKISFEDFLEQHKCKCEFHGDNKP